MLPCDFGRRRAKSYHLVHRHFSGRRAWSGSCVSPYRDANLTSWPLVSARNHFIRVGVRLIMEAVGIARTQGNRPNILATRTHQPNSISGNLTANWTDSNEAVRPTTRFLGYTTSVPAAQHILFVPVSGSPKYCRYFSQRCRAHLSPFATMQKPLRSVD